MTDFPRQTFSGKVLKFGYNVASIHGNDKVLYFHKFPPASNTTKSPNLERIYEDHELVSDNHISKESFINFINDTSLYQANGDWKGGEWGYNNFFTSIDLYIDDDVVVEKVKDGIIPFKCTKEFTGDENILSGSEEWAWSCNLRFQDKIISGYVCDRPMGQYAIDVLFVWENEFGDRFAKILKRGKSNPNVDMPESFMPGAGEHKEPGVDVKFKDGVLRAVREEIGLPDETLSQCSLLYIGSFSDDKRDPRYWKFSTVQDENIVEFGMERNSSTQVSLLYIKSNTECQPKETLPLDQVEVGQKKWVNLNDPLLDEVIWMIPEHRIYLNIANDIIDNFNKLSIDEREESRVQVN